jgi:hypothetical protein
MASNHYRVGAPTPVEIIDNLDKYAGSAADNPSPGSRLSRPDHRPQLNILQTIRRLSQAR